jgi:hypothetical protein
VRPEAEQVFMTSYIRRRFVGRDYNNHQDKTIVLQKIEIRDSE